ncbi:MAG: hypothetical protein JRI95_14140 [Deltaproteobacteria bacterium]|nr:hypothetical protein [Deltaproteobacteria bacterium]
MTDNSSHENQIEEIDYRIPSFLEPSLHETAVLSWLFYWWLSDLKKMIIKEEELFNKLLDKPELLSVKPYLFSTQEHRIEIVKNFLPRYLSYTFVTALWANMESAIKRTADYLKKKKEVEVKFNQIQGTVLEKAKIYYGYILHFSLYSDEDYYGEVFDKFYKVRNAIAHGNGLIENLRDSGTEKDIKEIEGIEIQDGRINLTIPYLNQIFNYTNLFLQDLRRRLLKEYPEE